MTAAPPAPQRSVVKVWETTWANLRDDLNLYAERILNGEAPLTVGEQRRLKTLINAVQAMRKVDPYRAQIAAAAYEKLRAAAEASQAIAQGAVPAWSQQAAKAAAGEIAGGFDLVDQRAIKATVKGVTGNMAKDFAQMSAEAQARMAADLVTSVAVGDGTRDLAKRIERSIEPQFGTAQSRSLRIARTQLARAYDLSRLEIYVAAAEDGLLKGWMWVANGPNVCDVCAALDGSVWPAGEDTYRHPNCACSTVPILLDDPEASTPFGENAVDRYDGANINDVERVTSPSGWTHWQRRAPGKPGPPNNKPVTTPPAKPILEGTAPGKAGTATARYTNGKITGDYGGDRFTWDGQQWIHGPTGSPAGPNSLSALNAAAKNGGIDLTGPGVYVGDIGGGLVKVQASGVDWIYSFTQKKWLDAAGNPASGRTLSKIKDAVKAATGKPTPVKPKVTTLTGKAPGKAGDAVVTSDGKTNITATYGGDDFHWDGKQWIHGPSGSPAGPNSIKALNDAASNGGITLPVYTPKVPGIPDWVIQAGPTKPGPDDLARGAAKKAADQHGSPYPQISEAEWRAGWDAASDGSSLPASWMNIPGVKKLMQAFRSYTSTYNKEGFANAAGAAWFRTAPMYIRTTWRGMRLGSREAAIKYMEANPPGSLLDTRGGWSMSFSERVARNFGGGSGPSSVMIEVRGGCSGLPVRGFSHYSSEDEILVNSQLRVVEVRYDSGGVFIIAEEVGKYGGAF